MKSFILNRLEIMAEDLPNKIPWASVTGELELLGGNGWRLPTENELFNLWRNKNKIGRFTDNFYWSSTEMYSTTAYSKNFNNGKAQFITKESKYNVRAVRFLGEGDPIKNDSRKKPVKISKFYTFGDLDVSEDDIKSSNMDLRMEWADAKKVCGALSDGWRLPTIDELKIMYKNLDFYQISKDTFWSSEESNDYARALDFKNGEEVRHNKHLKFLLRVVRDTKK